MSLKHCVDGTFMLGNKLSMALPYVAKERRNKLQNLRELTDRTPLYFNHQKWREDIKEVARESQDRMINSVF